MLPPRAAAPCTDAILTSGIRRVVIGSDDPNPLVAGKGIQLLRAQGITVTTGILREDCDRINAVFFHYIQTGLPYVVMKYAMTLDGKIAAAGPSLEGEARLVIEGAGKLVSPSFVDSHMHLDKVLTGLDEDAANTRAAVEIMGRSTTSTPRASMRFRSTRMGSASSAL